MAFTLKPAPYRTRALRFAYKWPLISAVLTQVVFWMMLNSVFVASAYLVLKAASLTTPDLGLPPFTMVWRLMMIISIVYGTALGMIDRLFERRFRPHISLGMHILGKGLLYSAAYTAIALVGLLALDHLIAPYRFGPINLDHAGTGRMTVLLTLAPTTLAGNFLISFINQVSRSFGPGMLAAMITGRYRKPVCEKRVFMFMDLRDSTALAERLGPDKYSAMVRDLFHDTDSVVPRYQAEVFQHVGDEVVLTWDARGLADGTDCLLLFFAVREAIQARSKRYLGRYGVLPEFKAGLHLGDVVAVEVGDIRREVAYHGDTINTASRIQGLCNDTQRTLLVSRTLLDFCHLEDHPDLKAEDIGKLQLKGKQTLVDVIAIECTKGEVPDLRRRTGKSVSTKQPVRT